MGQHTESVFVLRTSVDSPSAKISARRVEATTVQLSQGQGHNLRAGDWVIIRKHVRKSCLEPRWKGPYRIILVTTTDVKCAGLPNWVHASHTRKVNNPTEQEDELLRLPTTNSIPGQEQEREELEKMPENVRNGPTPMTDEKERSVEESESSTSRVVGKTDGKKEKHKGRLNESERKRRRQQEQVQASTLPPIHDPGYNLRAGDWVVVARPVWNRVGGVLTGWC
ncbi:uncharacterized protein [Pleurodeles waltl]|uniref:uncharacterized protein isoform X2 n=1 Tax=Pleurodeles waltl TaxID=8319 RepID=UPI003709A3B0